MGSQHPAHARCALSFQERAPLPLPSPNMRTCQGESVHLYTVDEGRPRLSHPQTDAINASQTHKRILLPIGEQAQRFHTQSALQHAREKHVQARTRIFLPGPRDVTGHVVFTEGTLHVALQKPLVDTLLVETMHTADNPDTFPLLEFTLTDRAPVDAPTRKITHNRSGQQRDSQTEAKQNFLHRKVHQHTVTE